jgi:hypothetical protein
MIHGFITMGRVIPMAGQAIRDIARAMTTAFLR